MGKSFTFHKDERLTSEKEIDELFTRGNNLLFYPLRFSYILKENTREIPVKVLTGVAKKKIRRAVKRNLIKRRIREAFRHNKHNLYQTCQKNNKPINLAVIYIGNNIESYSVIEKSLIKGLNEINNKMAGQDS
ncbi:MAG: ribonuclease P protein component [Bacteroidota bacterium]